ncbi:MAG: hypothetical protein ACTSUE_03530 [Promethearchaeota archaeon]
MSKIEAVYIIHQATGNCIVFCKYGNLEFNEDLIAGFLTALKDFSSEVTGGKGRMKNLDMGDYNILLIYDSGILVAGALGRRDDESIAHKALTSVHSLFVTEFKDVIPTWNGNLKVFKGFDKKVNKIVKNGKIAEKEIYAPLLKKKLPKQIVKMGAVSEDEYSFSEYLNGIDSPEEIAEKAGIPVEKVEVMIAKFKDLGFIKFNKL